MEDSGPADFYPDQNNKKRGGFNSGGYSKKQSGGYKGPKTNEGENLVKRPPRAKADPVDEKYKKLRIDMLATTTKDDQKDKILNTIFKQIKEEGITNVKFLDFLLNTIFLKKSHFLTLNRLSAERMVPNWFNHVSSTPRIT